MKTLSFIFVLSCASSVWAQDPADTSVAVDSPETVSVEKSTDANEMAELLDRIADLETQVGYFSQAMSDSASSDASEVPLQVYGFFDVNFGQAYFEKGSLMEWLFNDRASFIMSSVNVYFGLQPTESLSVLTELRFTFSPLGNNVNADVFGDPEVNFERTDTTYRDVFSLEEHQLGGVGIERAEATYSFRDWAQLKIGRFLTPYGIWNTDHSSLVTIPILVPYLIRLRMIPKAQTGLYAFGHLFLSDTWALNYGVTLTNGRGPMESVMDLDHHKATGARLKLTYEGSELVAALGTYGFYNIYRDEKISVTPSLTAEGKLDPNDSTALNINRTAVHRYRELGWAFDLSVKWKGLLLQSECVLRKVNFLRPSPLDLQRSLAMGGAPNSNLYEADFLGLDLYVLAAFEITGPADVVFTPYVLWEYSDENDASNFDNAIMYRGGLNVRPLPSLVLKMEGSYIDTSSSPISGDHLIRLFAQAAVGF